MNPCCVQKPASLTELASLAYTLYAEIWSFESVDSTDIKSVFVCDVCDRVSLMFLMSVPISVHVSLNVPGYVSSFISTLFMKVYLFSFWVEWRACSMDAMSFVLCICGLSVS